MIEKLLYSIAVHQKTEPLTAREKHTVARILEEAETRLLPHLEGVDYEDSLV
jgi:hypothetical protein